MERATIENALFGIGEAPQDSEEMFWLRQMDDAQSKIKLGTLLSSQYRFSEAACAFEDALRIHEDAMTYVRLGGAQLTLYHFDAAKSAYHSAVKHGLPEKQIAFQMGVLHYFLREYAKAADYFENCLPCDDELTIAAQYWHMLSCRRCGLKSEFRLHRNLRIVHHTAYKHGVELLTGLFSESEAEEMLSNMDSDLDFVIFSYALYDVYRGWEETEQSHRIWEAISERQSVWPCVSFLAAYLDQKSDYLKE